MSVNTQSNSDKTLLVMAGGTGGHIFPGLAVADYLRSEGWKISWLGNPSGMEHQIIPSRGIPFEGINFGGLRGKGLKTKLMLPFNLMRALIQSASILKKVNPSVVLGMGGYVSFPAGLAAVLMGYPLVLHEQNSVAGLTNKILAKLAGRRLCAFPDALPDAEWVGNPLRADLLTLEDPKTRFANRIGNLNILVVGGSLGAMALNTVLPEALSLIPQDRRPNVFHQSGEKHLAELKERYRSFAVEAEVVPFIENMASAYTKADLVICRAGAMTIAELSAGGVASCLVPFPHAVDDHQTSNARFLQQAGAAKLMPQSEMTPARLAQWIESLDRKQLTEMAERALQCAKPMATARVAAVCKELVSA